MKYADVFFLRGDFGGWSIIFTIPAGPSKAAEGADVHLQCGHGSLPLTPAHTGLLSESVAIPERHQITAMPSSLRYP